MKGSRTLLLAAAAVLAAISGSGCGYSSSMRVAERYSTVGLEFFGNDSLERDLERPLHEELSRALRDMSDAQLVEPRRADVVLKGRIVVYYHRGGIRSPDNVLLETGVRIDVEAYLSERGKPPREPQRFSTMVGYTLDDPSNETEARNRALRNLAEKVVLTLFAPAN